MMADRDWPTIYEMWSSVVEATQINGNSLRELLPEAVPSGGSMYAGFVRMSVLASEILREESASELLTLGWRIEPASQYSLISKGIACVLHNEGTATDVLVYSDGFAERAELQFLPAPAVLGRLPPPEEYVDPALPKMPRELEPT